MDGSAEEGRHCMPLDFDVNNNCARKAVWIIGGCFIKCYKWNCDRSSSESIYLG
jgi:hypothetical protein